MKKITSTLFLALVLAITATSASAQAPGQIPIMGRSGSELTKTDNLATNTAIEPKTEISSEISDYLRTIVSIISQFKF